MTRTSIDPLEYVDEINFPVYSGYIHDVIWIRSSKFFEFLYDFFIRIDVLDLL